jgi:hypothetical protein
MMDIKTRLSFFAIGVVLIAVDYFFHSGTIFIGLVTILGSIDRAEISGKDWRSQYRPG